MTGIHKHYLFTECNRETVKGHVLIQETFDSLLQDLPSLKKGEMTEVWLTYC